MCNHDPKVKVKSEKAGFAMINHRLQSSLFVVCCYCLCLSGLMIGLCLCVLSTVVPTKSDSDVIFCLQSYKGLRIDKSLVY